MDRTISISLNVADLDNIISTLYNTKYALFRLAYEANEANKKFPDDNFFTENALDAETDRENFYSLAEMLFTKIAEGIVDAGLNPFTYNEASA